MWRQASKKIKENIMKYILALMISLGLLAGTTTAYAGGEVKEVCKEVEKKGKKVQECKKVKVHKKVEGEKVPDGKKK